MAAQTAFFEKAVDQKLDAFRSELSSSLRQDSSVVGLGAKLATVGETPRRGS